MPKTYTLRENLRPGDLKDLIDPLVSVDRHVPKLGSNADTIVLAFKCESKLSAQDLGEFLEWSTNNILDVEVSESSDKQGKFLVYCEVTRIPGVTQKLLDIVKEIEPKIGEHKLIFFSEILDKRSKLRDYFEKSKKFQRGY